MVFTPILNYNGYKISFDFPENLKSDPVLFEKVKENLADKHLWFEAFLFELIYENNDGLPGERFGKTFLICLGEPLSNRGVREEDYLKMEKPSQDEISRGSVKIGGSLFPKIIYRQKVA